MKNIFQDSTKKLPKEPDSQIVRVSMKENEIAGRKGHIPSGGKSDKLAVQHTGSKK